jgi:DeoR/GlpR family transcriptional regulator of sugar metabolism
MSLQQKLLSTDKLTLDIATKMAVSDECARKDIALFKGQGRESDVHHIKKPIQSHNSEGKYRNNYGKPKCVHCGKQNHDKNNLF